MHTHKIRILDKKTLLKTRAFAVEERQIEVPPNNRLTRHVVVHNGAVVILALTEKNEIVFVRQYRHAVDSWLLELPAGTLEVDESPLLCAQRELSEESGFGAKEWSELGTLYPAPGFCSEKQYLFMAKSLFERKLEADQDEMIEVVTLPLIQIRQAICDGVICDAKSIALIARAEMLNLISFT